MDNASALTQEGFETLEDHKGNDQLALFSLQDLAVSTTSSIDELQKQLRTAKTMYKDSFLNSESYKLADDLVKEKQLIVKDIKVQIERKPEMIAQKNKIKELEAELKEKKVSLSDYATEVLRMSGRNEFEKDGELFEIQTVAKLVKRKQ